MRVVVVGGKLDRDEEEMVEQGEEIQMVFGDELGAGGGTMGPVEANVKYGKMV